MVKRILCVLFVLLISLELIIFSNGAYDKPCDIFVDGIETFCFVGSYATFTAPHIKMDNSNDKIYIFNGWRAEGVDLENPSSIRVSFIAPDNDVVLTPSYFRLGNVDNDAKESITALDILAFLNGIKNGSTDKALDINLDGSVTAIDKLYLLKLIKGNFDYTELYYSLQFEGKEIQRVERVASKVGTEEIPFIAVLQAAGATIEWDTETVASVKYNNKSYTLNISECLMYDNNNQSFNMISGVPGAYVTHTVAEKELYLEQTMVKVALKRVFGINYLVSIDHEERIINICQ